MANTNNHPVELPIKISLPAASKDDLQRINAKHVSSSGGSSALPNFRVTPAVREGIECADFRLVEIGNWPETKTEMVTECRDLGWPIGRVCADIPRVYQRTCTKFVYVHVCYPTGARADIEDCLKSAAVIGAITGVIASPSAGAAAFESALKACLIQKGRQWADQVRVSGDLGSECGDWH